MSPRKLFARALSVGAAAWLAVSLLGCPFDNGSCPAADSFALYEFVSTDLAQGISCDVQFANGTRVAEYTVAAPAARDGGGASPGCSENDSSVPCVVVSGPALTSPLHCHRTACEFTFYFTDAEAHAVSDYLGTDDMVDFTLTCGGFVRKHEKTYFVRVVCSV